jgi:hypothetical protein
MHIGEATTFYYKKNNNVIYQRKITLTTNMKGNQFYLNNKSESKCKHLHHGKKLWWYAYPDKIDIKFWEKMKRKKHYIENKSSNTICN